MPVPQISFHDFWRYINLYVYMYVCLKASLESYRDEGSIPEICKIPGLSACMRNNATVDKGAVKFLSAELSEVSKTRYLTIKILSVDFASASKNSRKKSLLPSKNRHYVSD